MKKIITNVFLVVITLTSVILILSMANSLFKGSAQTSTTGAKDISELDEVNIRISAGNSETHPQTLGLYAMKKYVETESDGKITVDIFANGQLGDEDVSLEQVQTGTLEMCTASIAPITTFQNKFQVFDIPFLFNGYEEAWMVLDSHVGETVMDSLNEVDLKGLAWMENGFRHTTTKSSGITSIDSFKGVKIRTMSAPMHILNFETLGSNPTPVPFAELYMAVSQNIVDGQENPIANVWDLSLFEVQNYLSLTGHLYDSMPLICNLSWWNELPAEYQTIIQKGAIAGQNYSRFSNFGRESVLQDMLKEKGMEIVVVSEEARDAMKEQTQQVVSDAVKKEIGTEFVEEFLSGLEDVRSDITKGVQ